MEEVVLRALSVPVERRDAVVMKLVSIKQVVFQQFFSKEEL